MIIDAQDMILGRLAAFAARKALLGEKVDIINCDKAVISGPRRDVIKRYMTITRRGTPKGPIYHKSPDRFVRRTIRGMLPYKQPKGREAFKRIMCYRTAEEIKGDAIKVEGAEKRKLPLGKYITIKELCKNLGGK